LGTLDLGGTATKVLHGGRTFNNTGSGVWRGGTIQSYGGAVFNNLGGASFEVQTNSQWTVSTGGGTINNFGLFRKTVGTGNTLIYPPLNNSGDLDILSGTIVLAGTSNRS
jgi:hypothetical protein